MNILGSYRRWKERRQLRREFNTELGRLLAFKWRMDPSERAYTDASERARQLLVDHLRLQHSDLAALRWCASNLDCEPQLNNVLGAMMGLAASAARVPLQWEAGHVNPHSVNHARPEFPRWLS